MIAQSVGGSGGTAGVTGALSSVSVYNFAGSSGDGGDSGTVSVVVGGPIAVSGEEAHGVFAQSAAGSVAGDESGDVTIEVEGSISATGENGRAILAQSEGTPAAAVARAFGLFEAGTSSNGAIKITVDQGATVPTGTNGAETIGLFGGAGNTIINNGTITQNNPQSYALRTDGTATTTLENNGTFMGNILAGSGTAADVGVTVENTGRFGFGTDTNLSTNGSFLSSGTMSAAGFGTVGRSEITAGSFSQTTTGTTQVDFAFGGLADIIVVTAASSSIAGTIDPNPVDTLPNSGDSGSIVTMEFDGPVEFGDLSVASTATVDYSLSRMVVPNVATSLLLNYDVDYTPWNGTATSKAKVPPETANFITANHTSFGNHVDDLVRLRRRDRAGGTDELAFIDNLVLYLLELEEVSDLVDVYDRFAPGEIFVAADAALMSSVNFADKLNSCPAMSEGEGTVFSQEGSCVWMQLSGIARRIDRDGLKTDYDEDVFAIAAGAQSEVAEGWFAGGAIGYERFSISNPRADGDGNRFQAGAVLKKELGNTLLSGSVSGGIGSYDLRREVIAPGARLHASSDPTTSWVSGHARAAHTIALGETFSIKPWVDVGVTYVAQDGFRETGAGPYGLDVASFDETFATVNPAVDLSAAFQSGGISAEAKLRAGVLAVFGSDGFDTTARLVGVGGAGPSFQVEKGVDQVFADLGASIEVEVHERATIEGSFDTLLSGNQQEYIGAARVNIAF